MNKIVVAGAGAHCKVILDMLMDNGDYEIVGLIDADSRRTVFGIPIIGDDSRLQQIYDQGIHNGFVAIGNNAIRKKVQKKMEKIGFHMISLISRHAVVSRFARVESGTAVMPGAIINADARIGKGCILNTNCSIDHDCCVGDFCHIAPGCAVSGSTHIGACVFMGTGSRAIDGVSIGANSIVGAGATVISDLPQSCLALGTPAKVKKEIGEGE